MSPVANALFAVTDATFDTIEGDRAFDVAWGVGSCLLTLLVASPLVFWLVGRRRVAYFGPAVDPTRMLQFGWGLFGMFLAFTNLGCRVIDHHHLEWVHPGFLALTLAYVVGFGPRVVRLALRAERGARRTAVTGLVVTVCAAGLLASVAPGIAASAVSSDVAAARVATACAGARYAPVHGTLLARSGDVVHARFDAVPLERPAGAAALDAVARPGAAPVAIGSGFDALLATCPGGAERLVDLHAAERFVAGLPLGAPGPLLVANDPLPSVPLVDSRGRIVDLGALAPGKILLLSFVFSRCPDRTICPAISGKFSYLQHRLDPAKYHLALVTLDPPYDSPAVFTAYGRQFGQDPTRWTLLSGTGSDVAGVLQRFEISSLADRPGNYVHEDRLAIVAPDGRIAQFVETAGWNPDDVVAQVESLDGREVNPLRRLELASVAQVAAFCGGGSSVGVVVLDSVVFVGGVIFLSWIIWLFARKIFVREPEGEALL